MYALLIAFAIFNCLKWCNGFVKNKYLPIDFRTYYISASSYFKGYNAYKENANLNTWNEVKYLNKESWKTHLGFPHAIPVYAPQYVWFFGIYTLLDFETAMWEQFVLNILALFLIVFCIYKFTNSISTLFIIAIVFAFRGTWYAMETGQPMLQVLAVCLFSLYLIDKKNLCYIPGILIGFVSFKFTLILPFALYLLCNKQYKTLVIIAVTVAILNSSALIYSNHPIELYAQWKSNIEALWAYPYTAEAYNGIAIISTNFNVALEHFLSVNLNVLKFLSMFILGSLFLLIFLTNWKKKPYYILFLASLASICFGQHLLYDILALICFRLLTIQESEKISIIETLLFVLLILPIGSIANMTGILVLHYALPFMLLLYCVERFYLNYFKNGKIEFIFQSKTEQ